MNLTINQQTVNDFIPYVNQFDIGNDTNEKFKISMSIGLFLGKVVSLERASELAGKTVNEYVKMLIEKNIVWANYTNESDKMDDISLEKYKNLSNND